MTISNTNNNNIKTKQNGFICDQLAAQHNKNIAAAQSVAVTELAEGDAATEPHKAGELGAHGTPAQIITLYSSIGL